MARVSLRLLDRAQVWRHGLPSEVALLTLYDPRRGVPVALLDATDITAWRTGAVTAIGARHLAPPRRACSVTSARAVATVEEAVTGADIVIEATRLEKPELLIEDDWLAPNCLLVAYGWKMAVDPRTVLSASKVVVDDWAQCTKGGQLHPMIERGELTREALHAEIGAIVAGRADGRVAGDGRIVFWHRGFAVSDIVVGHAVLAAAEHQRVGGTFTLFDGPDE